MSALENHVTFSEIDEFISALSLPLNGMQGVRVGVDVAKRNENKNQANRFQETYRFIIRDILICLLYFNL